MTITEYILRELNGLREGIFVEVGAGNGIIGSHTYVLEKDFGWKGLCIEPNEQVFDSLVKNRSCSCLNEVLFSSELDVKFYKLWGLSGIENFNKIPPESRSNFSIRRTKTITNVLDSINFSRLIDVVILDIEGAEYEVIKSFDFSKYISRIFVIEKNTNFNLIQKIMANQGFKEGSIGSADAIFTRI